MKKTTIFSLLGLFLLGNLFAEDYDTVVQRNGTKFQIMLAPKERISLGTYNVPVELSDQQARDMIEGKTDGLELTWYAGTIPKEIFLLDFVDCYKTDTYKYISVASSIKSTRSVGEVKIHWFGIILIVLFGLIIPGALLFLVGWPGEYSTEASEPFKRIIFSLSIFLTAIILLSIWGALSDAGGGVIFLCSVGLAFISGMISTTFSVGVAVFFSGFISSVFAKFTASVGASYYGLMEYFILLASICLCSFGFWWYKRRLHERKIMKTTHVDKFLHV